MKSNVILVLLFLNIAVLAQSPDSLWSVWENKEEKDSIRLWALGKFARDVHLFSQPDSANYFADIQFEYAKEKGLISHMAAAQNLKATHYYVKGDYFNAVDYFGKAAELLETIADKKGLASAYGNMGVVFNIQGNSGKAMEYSLKSMLIEEELGNREGVLQSLINVGMIHYNMNDNEKAENSFKRALQLADSLNNQERAKSYAYNNLAMVYEDRNEHEKSIELYSKGLELKKELNDLSGVAKTYANIGVVYYAQYQFDTALSYYEKSYLVYEQLTDESGMSASLNSIGRTYHAIGDRLKGEGNVLKANYYYKKALEKCNKSLELAKKAGALFYLKGTASALYDIHKSMGEYEKALNYYEQHIHYRDSLKSEENQKEIIRSETKHEFEKAQLLKEQEQKEQLRKNKFATQRRNNLQYSIILVAILVVFGVVMSLGYIKVSSSVAEGLIFFAFLILFEFLLVLTDPYIDDITNSEPMYKLLANAILAGAIFPAHAFFERVLKVKLIKNNKHE